MERYIRIICCIFTFVCPRLLDAAPQTRTDTVPVVDVHVGDDDERGDTFVYTAPPGWEITDARLGETGKYGDAQYSIASRTSSEVKVAWHVHSHRVRGPFDVVVDTHTAYLGLNMNVSLQKLPDPVVPPAPPEQWPRVVAVVSGIVFLVTILIVAILIAHPSPFQLFVFRLILAIAAAGFGTTLPGVLGVRVASIPNTNIEAGGAIALFIIIYIINPARLVTPNPPPHNDKDA